MNSDKAQHILVTAPLGFGGITSMMINIQKNLDRDKLNFDYLVLHDRHEDLEDIVLGMVSAFIENVFVYDGGRIVVRFKYEQSIQDAVKALHTG